MKNEPRVLQETSQWWVVDKPSGWLTIPGRTPQSKQEGGSSPYAYPVLLDWMKAHYRAEGNPAPEVWVVHRLDRDTSGVVLFAKSAEDHALANEWFQSRKVKKTYLCLAQGRVDVPFFKISSPILGAASSTQVEILQSYASAFLAKVFPRTGRRHQIRIHLAQSGCPLLGDTQYGGASQLDLGGRALQIPRVALHASTLELPTGDQFEAPLPQDFVAWITEMEKASSEVPG